MKEGFKVEEGTYLRFRDILEFRRDTDGKPITIELKPRLGIGNAG